MIGGFSELELKRAKKKTKRAEQGAEPSKRELHGLNHVSVIEAIHG